MHPYGDILTKPPAEYYDYSTKHYNNIDVGTAWATLTAMKYGMYGNLNDWFGNAAGSTTVFYEIKPDLPTNIKLVEKDGKAVMSWTAAKAPGVTYVIYRSVDGKTWSEYAATTELSYTFDDPSGLEGNYFRIKTQKFVEAQTVSIKNADNNGTYEVVIDGKWHESIYTTKSVRFSPKLAVSLHATVAKPRLTWTSVTGAIEYQVWFSKDDGETFTKLFSTKGLTCTHTGAAIGRKYTYKVVAVFEDETQTISSNIVNATAVCMKPAVTIGSDDNGRPVISWDKVTGATKYVISRADSIDGQYVEIGNTKALAYVDASAQSNKTYFYKVTPISSKGDEGFTSEVVSYTTGIIVVLDLPTDVRIVESNGNAVITWTASEAQGITYVIYKSTDGENWSEYAATTELSYLMEAAEVEGASFKIGTRIVVEGETYNSEEYTEEVYAAPKLVTTLHAEVARPRLEWTAIAGATKYEVWFAREGNSTFSKLFTTTGLGCTHIAGYFDVEYTYKVVAIFEDGTKTFFSNEVVNKAVCERTNVTISTNIIGRPVISWETVKHADKYIISRADSADGQYVEIGTTNAAVFLDTTAAENNTYFYKVTAVTAKGSLGLDSEVVSFTVGNFIVVELPTDIKIIESNGNAVMSWTASKTPDVTYVIYKSTDGETWSEYATTTELNYVIQAAEVVGASFKIETKLVKNGEIETSKDMSEEVYAAPKLVTMLHNSVPKPRLEWTAVAGAAKYEVWFAKEGSTTFNKLFTTTGLGCTHIAGYFDVEYTYKVVAIFEDGTQTFFSNVVVNRAVCDSPNVTISADERGNPILYWDAVKHAEEYIISRADNRDGDYVELAITEMTVFLDNTVEVGITYYYKVTPVSAKGNEGRISNIATFAAM